jgi:hypothetical protein
MGSKCFQFSTVIAVKLALIYARSSYRLIEQVYKLFCREDYFLLTTKHYK